MFALHVMMICTGLNASFRTVVKSALSSSSNLEICFVLVPASGRQGVWKGSRDNG